MNLRGLAAPAAGVACLCACATSAPVSAVQQQPSQPAKSHVSADVSTLAACSLGDAPLELLVPSKLIGPAAGAVTAGRVTKGWSVDGGDIRVSPAETGARPTVPMQRAACNLLAANTPNGAPVSALAAGGSTLGYGRLTVSTHLGHNMLAFGQTEIQPVPPVYDNRPAWILTLRYVPPPPCAVEIATPTPAPSPTTAPTPTWSYEVFAVDATTGRDSITYVETAPLGCGGGGESSPSSSVPYEQVSVPWRGLSLSSAAATGQIEIYAPACATFPEAVWVDRDRPQVEVGVARAVGHACGPITWRPVVLRPATVTQTIPRQLAHAAVGPVDHIAPNG